MDWRKLKAGERVFVFPNRYPCIVISVGKPEGRDGADTKVYLRRLDSHEERTLAWARNVFRTRGLV